MQARILTVRVRKSSNEPKVCTFQPDKKGKKECVSYSP